MQVTSRSELAAEALAEGRLAVLPTETVYGLGGRADDPAAVARIYAVKGRPADHPLIVHLAHAQVMSAWARSLPEYARALGEAFWPGPLTLVLPRSERARDFVTGAQDSVAVRVPAHPVTSQVLMLLGDLVQDEAIGIAAPSANRFGQVSPTTAAHAREEIGDSLQEGDVILDAGPCQVGLESTIVDCTADHPRLLRPGAISAADIEQVTGLPVTHDSLIRASGTLESHYAPRAIVEVIEAGQELTSIEAEGDSIGAQGDRGLSHDRPRTGLLALASVPTPRGMVRLSAPAHPQAYAHVLYAALREADALDLSRVLVVLPPSEGIGAAIHDRITRAARGRGR